MKCLNFLITDQYLYDCERIVYNRLIEYLNEHNLLYFHQYRFGKKTLCAAMALVQLIDRFSRALDNNEFTIGVFIDLSKAFNTVDHSLLVKKLQLYGIRGIELQWFCDANSLFLGMVLNVAIGS